MPSALSSWLGFADQGLPECRRIDDLNTLDFTEAEEVGVSADKIVGAASGRALEELVVVRISALRDAGGWRDQGALPPEELDERGRFDRGYAELAKDLWATQHILHFGQDWLGERQGEAAGVPGRVDLGGDTRGG